MKTNLQIAEDACIIRSILDLLQEEPEPVITVQLVAMTQAVSQDTARRLLRNLAKAGVIERFTRDAEVIGVKQKVPCIGWILSEKARRGEIPSAEKMARGTA